MESKSRKSNYADSIRFQTTEFTEERRAKAAKTCSLVRAILLPQRSKGSLFIHFTVFDCLRRCGDAAALPRALLLPLPGQTPGDAARKFVGRLLGGGYLLLVAFARIAKFLDRPKRIHAH